MSEPDYCPACGRELAADIEGKAIVELAAGGHEVYCPPCGWHGDVVPNDGPLDWIDKALSDALSTASDEENPR